MWKFNHLKSSAIDRFTTIRFPFLLPQDVKSHWIIYPDILISHCIYSIIVHHHFIPRWITILWAILSSDDIHQYPITSTDIPLKDPKIPLLNGDCSIYLTTIIQWVLINPNILNIMIPYSPRTWNPWNHHEITMKAWSSHPSCKPVLSRYIPMKNDPKNPRNLTLGFSD